MKIYSKAAIFDLIFLNAIGVFGVVLSLLLPYSELWLKLITGFISLMCFVSGLLILKALNNNKENCENYDKEPY